VTARGDGDRAVVAAAAPCHTRASGVNPTNLGHLGLLQTGMLPGVTGGYETFRIGEIPRAGVTATTHTLDPSDLERPFDPHGLFGDRALERQLDDEVSTLLAAFEAQVATTSALPFEALVATSDGEPAATPRDPLSYLRGLGDRLVPHAYNTGAARYVGHMTAGLPSFARPISRLIVGLHQNTVKVETAKSATVIEREAIGQLHTAVFGAPAAFYRTHTHARDSTLGMVTSGGTAANLTALWIARNRALGAAEHDGLAAALAAAGHRRAVVIGSSLMHYSLDKAADLLGIGRRQLIRLPADRAGRLSPERAAAAIADHRARGDVVLALVGIAGTTECGSIDPLTALARVAAQAGTALHVDAAWAGPLVLSERHRAKLAGIERADSVTIDGHKQLYLPMGLGVVLLRDPDAAAAIEKQAAYIIRAASADLGRRALEGSRPAASILLHAGLQLLGRAGYAALLDRGIALARAFAEEVSARPGFELLGAPDCNIVTYRVHPPALDARPDALDALNRWVQDTQRDRGRAFVSRTTLSHLGATPVVALRAVLANPRTTLADLRAVLAEQAELAAHGLADGTTA
jgi:putative pyridoxal-dependent aspartate 1-decarboxylase